MAATHSSTGDGTGEVNNTQANRNGADDYMLRGNTKRRADLSKH